MTRAHTPRQDAAAPDGTAANVQELVAPSNPSNPSDDAGPLPEPMAAANPLFVTAQIAAPEPAPAARYPFSLRHCPSFNTVCCEGY